jgi:hypothetical protein
MCLKAGLHACGTSMPPSQLLQELTAHLHLVPMLFAELGNLRYLQFFNLTCNDCGGRTSSQCINSTSCALAPSVCTCPNASSSNSSTPATRHLLQGDSGSTAGGGDPAGNSTWGNGTNVLLGVGEAGAASSCNYANFSL